MEDHEHVTHCLQGEVLDDSRMTADEKQLFYAQLQELNETLERMNKLFDLMDDAFERMNKSFNLMDENECVKEHRVVAHDHHKRLKKRYRKNSHPPMRMTDKTRKHSME